MRVLRLAFLRVVWRCYFGCEEWATKTFLIFVLSMSFVSFFFLHCAVLFSYFDLPRFDLGILWDRKTKKNAEQQRVVAADENEGNGLYLYVQRKYMTANMFQIFFYFFSRNFNNSSFLLDCWLAVGLNEQQGLPANKKISGSSG